MGLLFVPSAVAGSDVVGNVSPAAQVPGGLADRYPLGNYALDQHFKAVDASITGGVDVSGVPAMIAHFLANALWQLTAFASDALITVFGFAFSLDLVSGSSATNGAGALQPVGQAIRHLYSDVLGRPWLVAAVAGCGIWAMWRALIQRRYTETAGALGLSLLYLVVALAFVTQPERTVGQATRWTNDMSVAFLSLSHTGSLANEQAAKRAASDQLFSLLVYEPWTVLQFGGREHCVRNGTGSADTDPVSVPVRPLSPDPTRDSQLAAQLQNGVQVAGAGKTCINNRAKYARYFLAYPPGSDQRDQAYQALNQGDTAKLPDPGDHRRPQLGPADRPATDAMEAGGQYQRLLIAIVVFAGALGALLLLGSLSIGVLLAQILLLLALAFAPVALVIGVLPGRGHDFFRAWLARIAGFVVRKAAYSLILAVLLAVNSALATASTGLGWLLSFGLQALFFWSVFLYRHQLTDRLLAATTGPGSSRHEGTGRLANAYYSSQLAIRPIRALSHKARTTSAGQPDPRQPLDDLEPEPVPTRDSRSRRAAGVADGTAAEPGRTAPDSARDPGPQRPPQAADRAASRPGSGASDQQTPRPTGIAPRVSGRGREPGSQTPPERKPPTPPPAPRRGGRGG